MNLQEVTLKIAEIKKAIADESERHAKAIDALMGELTLANQVREYRVAGLDADRIEQGRRVVEVHGRLAGAERPEIVSDACEQIALGGGKLLEGYFGTKDYDRWHDQRCDCPYGMGPRHGSIVFRVGLASCFRERNAMDLTPADIDAALYYLNNLEAVQAAEESAK